MSDKYILVNKEPVRIRDIIEWAKGFEDQDRRVARDTVGDAEVSTVFLGIDHSFGDSEKPVLFETMIFGGPLDQEMWRYCTWDEAVEGHAKALELARIRAAEITESS